jgi:hypothetical protein
MDKTSLAFRAEKRIAAQTATIRTKIHVENTVFVTEDKNPVSANACGGIDRICGAFCADMFERIIDEIFELQVLKKSSFGKSCFSVLLCSQRIHYPSAINRVTSLSKSDALTEAVSDFSTV